MTHRSPLMVEPVWRITESVEESLLMLVELVAQPKLQLQRQ